MAAFEPTQGSLKFIISSRNNAQRRALYLGNSDIQKFQTYTLSKLIVVDQTGSDQIYVSCVSCSIDGMIFRRSGNVNMLTATGASVRLNNVYVDASFTKNGAPYSAGIVAQPMDEFTVSSLPCFFSNPFTQKSPRVRTWRMMGVFATLK